MKTPVSINVEGQTIRGWFYTPESESKNLAVLFIHGWTGKPNDNAAEVLARQGYYALTISLRGHNSSDGDINQVSRRDGLADVVAAYDYLRAHVPASTKIVAAGNSYGGYMVALVSAERQVDGLSLRVPAAYPDEGFAASQMGKGHADPKVMKWRETQQTYQGNRGFEAMHAFSGPIQIVEAENDELVPHQTVQNYKNAVSDEHQLEYVVMKGWPHSLGDDVERNKQFQQTFINWLKSSY